MAHFTTERRPTEARSRIFWDYIAIARLDHSTKHIFIVPGIVLAYLLRGSEALSLLSLGLGLVTAVCIASGNYVINEWLDRNFDKHHPTKKLRVAVQRELSGSAILFEWTTLVAVGLSCALAASTTMFAVALIFALQGVIYNVQPLRTKDKPYVDVISESINNPLRLMIGWAIVDPTTLPPSSVILVFWLGGAFLMAAKRLSEYREIVTGHGRDLLVRYRASFAGYTEASLTVSCFVYALLCSFCLGVFLIKYHVEYILTFPIITILFAKYFLLSLRPGSSAQSPEKLFRERHLIIVVFILALTFMVTTYVDLPWLHTLTQQQYISLQ